MKSLFIAIVSLFVGAAALAQSSSPASVRQAFGRDWRCQCSFTDANRAHYWGASNKDLETAVDRAHWECINRTDVPGTCEVASYDPCACK